MPSYRCPHPSHAGGAVPLKSNDDRIFECEVNHRFYRRREGERSVLVDLISNESHQAEPFEGPAGESAGQIQLNFMTDVPQVRGDLDFNDLSLSAPEWKILSKADGRSTLEEVRLLAGVSAEDAEQIIRRLIEAGLLEIRTRQ